MDHSTPSPDEIEILKPLETWHQDAVDPDLWHHANGLIVNGAALDERGRYYRVVRAAAVAGGANATTNPPGLGA